MVHGHTETVPRYMGTVHSEDRCELAGLRRQRESVMFF